jgi:hypothetical protein
MKAGLIHEQDGATSSRRFLALLSFSNGIALSWRGTDWKVILLFIIASMIFLGYTTVAEIIDGWRTKATSKQSLQVEQFGNSKRLEQ